MKVLSVVGDTPGWAYISEIFHEMLSVIRNWRPKKRKQHWNRSCWNGSPIWISISAFVSGASTGILAGCPRQGSVKTMILTAGIPLTM